MSIIPLDTAKSDRALAALLAEINARPDTRPLARRIAAVPMPRPEERALASAEAREIAIRLARRSGAADPRAACKAAMARAAAEARAHRNRERSARQRAEATAAVPERHCADPACGKLLVRRKGEDLTAYRERTCCNSRCSNAARRHRAQVAAARDDGGLAALAAEPARWLTSDEVGRAAGIDWNAARHRLETWSGGWGWVERTFASGKRSLWRITAAGLDGVREARQ